MGIVRTNRLTSDGLVIYDLDPLAAELWVIAGPEVDDDFLGRISDEQVQFGVLPDGFRWVTDEEWSAAADHRS